MAAEPTNAVHHDRRPRPLMKIKQKLVPTLEIMNAQERSHCVCGALGTSTCGRCGRVYCSRECQVADWKTTHKARCDLTSISKRVAAAAALKLTEKINAMFTRADSVLVNIPDTAAGYLNSADGTRIVYISAGVSQGTHSQHPLTVRFNDCDFSLPFERGHSDIRPPPMWTVYV